MSKKIETTHSYLLGILSALYVGGFEHVYVHSDVEPAGKWWSDLKNENVTYVPLEKPDLVFQQKVTFQSHFSDISR